MIAKAAAYLDSLAAVAIIIAALTITSSVLNPRQNESAASAAGTDAAVAEELEQVEPIDVLNTVSAIGASDARIGLIEFSDYQCPFCARHASDTIKTIREEFVDTGVLRYVFVNLPLQQLHPFALKAANAAECAGAEGKFWEMHDRLFTHQKTLSDSLVSRFAIDLDLNRERFGSCLTGEAMAAKLDGDLALASRLGITSTPTFVLGEIRSGKIAARRKIRGAVAYDVFRSNIEALRNSDPNRTGV